MRPRARYVTPRPSRSTRKRRSVVVVGAGIAGLATAYELARRDADVVVVGDGRPGQSDGLGRIFRIAHRDPRLCALALEAHARWREWEDELGAGTLLGREGLVVTAPGRAGAMRAAGAPVHELAREQIRERIPHLSPPTPGTPASSTRSAAASHRAISSASSTRAFAWRLLAFAERSGLDQCDGSASSSSSFLNFASAASTSRSRRASSALRFLLGPFARAWRGIFF